MHSSITLNDGKQRRDFIVQQMALHNSRARRSHNDAIEYEAIIDLVCGMQFRLKAQLLAGLSKTAWGKPTGCPECDLDVWIEEGDDELVTCRGVFGFRDLDTRILWLGGAGSNSVHERVRGNKYVLSLGSAETKRRKQTLANAVLGVFAAISEKLGGRTLCLEALDDGSGKLVDMYEKYGFCKNQQCVGRDGFPQMNARANDVATYAPSAWVESLLPASFDAAAWFHRQITPLWMCTKTFPRWTFSFPWPAGLTTLNYDVKVDSAICRTQQMLLTASVTSALGCEMLCAQTALDFDRRSLVLLWMGRSGQRVASSAFRGRASHSVNGYGVNGSRNVTSAVALLGLVATIGSWLGASVVEMRAFDDGSGKLINYFKSLNFLEMEVSGMHKHVSSQGAWERLSQLLLKRLRCPKLSADIRRISANCCPLEWYEKVSKIENLTNCDSKENQKKIILIS